MYISISHNYFSYPYKLQFPFDEIAVKIVRALEKRQWTVPGITVDFFTYETNYGRYKMVNSIVGKNFKLEFGRIQGIIDGSWNNIAGLHMICIPQQAIEVYNDESGPDYYLYVGENWARDKDWFMNSYKSNGKLLGEHRRYLKYTGNIYTRRRSGRPTELIHEKSRFEFSPRGEEPTCIDLDSKFDEFTKWIKDNVLDYILSFPENPND